MKFQFLKILKLTFVQSYAVNMRWIGLELR